ASWTHLVTRNLPFPLANAAFLLPGLAGSDSGVQVQQAPSLVSRRQNELLQLNCSVNQANYYFYWYHQLPGQTALQLLGWFGIDDNHLQEPKQELKERLSGKRDGKVTHLELKSLQQDDSGLYLCASKYTVTPAGTGTQLLVKGRAEPAALLMTPACHGEGATLVCLIQGLPYSWPVSVIWKRDGEVLSEAIATEHERARARAECDFVVASRLRLSATEWASSHEYTCLGRQGEVATKESSFRSTVTTNSPKQCELLYLTAELAQDFLFMLSDSEFPRWFIETKAAH
uniref:Ig-like domain-containing protein n=1 Tax=Varanus komodoensis TaxID=61221 RepID=A0A8D2LGC2_VARKO